MQELEEEEELRECDAATGNVQIRQPTWVDPYKVLAVPSEFPGGSSDTSILTGYAHYIARCELTSFNDFEVFDDNEDSISIPQGGILMIIGSSNQVLSLENSEDCGGFFMH
ncbi:hypothetical protein P8452_52953 [Trifolium repens]|nr:hypothetical protein P8452_52953 [Trifolium repens]